LDQLNFLYISLSPKYPPFTKRVLVVNCYIDFVNYCAHRQNVYTILTNRVDYIEVTGTVPVGCIAVQYGVTMFTVEYKKLRIRDHYVY